jgi:Zn finger protein HypA/HybF involved in hydrogenase expression
MPPESDLNISGNSTRRINLIDLVLAVVFCGLVVATFTSPHGIRESNFTFMAATAVGIFWYLLRQTRSGPTCEECGARFYPDRPAAETHCPHCGEKLAAIRQMPSLRGVVVALIALLLAVCLLAIFAVALDPLRELRSFDRRPLAAIGIAAASGLLAASAVAWLVATRRRSVRPGARTCQECGTLIPAKPPALTICPNCRSRRLTENQMKEAQTKSNRFIVVFLGILAAFAIAGIVVFIPSASKIGIGPMSLVVAPTAFVVLFLAWKLIPILINSRRLGGILGEQAALAKARACSGLDGTVSRVGPATVWYSGPDDPLPIVQDEIVASHRRLEDLLGETAIAEAPLTILCFHDRAALLKLYKTLFPYLDLAAHPGLYLQRPWNIMALCTGDVAGRLDDARSTLGSLYCLVLLEQAFGQFTAPWLQAGITASLAARRNRGDLYGLNRRILAALSMGIDWSESLFTASANQVGKLLLRTKDQQSVRKFELFNEQAWSIVEYLAGEQATESQKTAFRAFVKDKRPRARQEQAFFQHFGFGFGSLLESWRQWVQSQGYGYGEPPSPRIEDALLNRLLPVIRDPQALRADRIQAIREWRKAGAPIGADALIDLLRHPGDIPKDEITWALAGVSGMAWGDEPDRWQAWLDELLGASAMELAKDVEPRQHSQDRLSFSPSRKEG